MPKRPRTADRQTHYWLYQPGRHMEAWESCLAQNQIVYDAHGLQTDLGAVRDIQLLRASLHVLYPDNAAQVTMIAQGLWDFSHKICPGDVIYAKSGVKDIMGRGIIEGKYTYDAGEEKYPHRIAVRWTHSTTQHGLWPNPKTINKSLVDISEDEGAIILLESYFT